MLEKQTGTERESALKQNKMGNFPAALFNCYFRYKFKKHICTMILLNRFSLCVFFHFS